VVILNVYFGLSPMLPLELAESAALTLLTVSTGARVP